MEVKESALPFRHWVIDGLVDNLPSIVIPPRPCIPDPGWVQYSNDFESKKRTCNDFDKMPSEAATVLKNLNAAQFISWLSELTGVHLHPDPQLYGAGFHIMDPGGWLNPHLDYALHPSGMERRVNLVLFLNAEWQPHWGGAFALCDQTGATVERVYPAFNRAIVWMAGDDAMHGTEGIELYRPPGWSMYYEYDADTDDPLVVHRKEELKKRTRATIATYYLAPPRPGTIRRRALFVPRR